MREESVRASQGADRFQTSTALLTTLAHVSARCPHGVFFWRHPRDEWECLGGPQVSQIAGVHRGGWYRFPSESRLVKWELGSGHLPRVAPREFPVSTAELPLLELIAVGITRAGSGRGFTPLECQREMSGLSAERFWRRSAIRCWATGRWS